MQIEFSFSGDSTHIKMFFYLLGCPLAASFESVLAKETVAILQRLLNVVDTYKVKEPIKEKKKAKFQVFFFIIWTYSNRGSLMFSLLQL